MNSRDKSGKHDYWELCSQSENREAMGLCTQECNTPVLSLVLFSRAA